MMLHWPRLSSRVALGLLLVGCGAGCSSEDPAAVGSPDPVPPPPNLAPTLAPSLDRVPNAWLVELDGPPLARGGEHKALRQERKDFRSRLVDARVSVRERFEFTRLWNGLSLEVGAKDLPTLATLPGVKAIFPVVRVRQPLDVAPTAGNQADMASALGMTGVDIVQNSLGLTGAGVRVGIIDSGIDYDHPDLGGCFGPGCKVAYGYDFVGDDFDSDTPGSIPQPDDDPDDCSSHGTAVAGILGADGLVKGVAPGATLGAYRVFGCSGATSPELIIEAMEKAFDDGMQVVNLSIGAPFEWPEYPTAKAANELVRKGVVVVASVGNNGHAGLFAAGASGVGKRVIGVASFDNLASTQPAFTLSPDNTVVGFNPMGVPPPATGTLPLARTGTTTTSDDACLPLPAGSFTGKATLIRRGTCSAYTKALHAMNAGAAVVVIYNDAAGQYYPSLTPTGSNPPITIPVVTITAASGALMDGRIASGPTTLTWGSQTVSTPLPTAGRISTSSSWGLANDLTVKPDIGAPGGSIYTTLTIEAGRHGITGGTSMAAPHVAGAAALLLEARPGLPAYAMRDILQNHAQPGAWSGDSTGNTPDCVHRQGAGLLQIDAAIASTVNVSPARIATGESQAGPFTQRLSIVNHGPKPIFVDVSHVPAASTSGSIWTPTIASGGAATVDIGHQTLFLGPGRPVSVSVTITANPGLADGSIYGGYLVFTPRGGAGAGTVRVPYAGFKGDYQALPILTPMGYDLPWLARVDGNDITPFPNGETFTLKGNDIPTLFVHFDHAVRQLRIDALEAGTQGWIGTVLQEDFLPRSVSPNSVTDYPWDGRVVFRKKVRALPNGVYVLKVSVLKPLGNSRVAADWETWTSPEITLQRP